MSTTMKRKLLRKNEPESFEDYLALHGKDAASELSSATAEAKVTAALSSAKRGALGEGIKSKGLSGSGYEDYLRGREELAANAKIDTARHKSELVKSENRSAYAKYLTQFENVQSKLADEMVDKLSESETPDYNEMLMAAINAGLTEERAVIAASTAFRRAGDNAVYKAIAFAKKNDLTPARAKSYALSMGLNEELAARVYKATEALANNLGTKSQSLTQEEFNKYIVELSRAYTDYRTGEELETKTIKERTYN